MMEEGMKGAPVPGFDKRLRELREDAGHTQEALARLAGLTRDAIAKLEAGVNAPTFATVLALAGALRITCHDFVSGKKPKGKKKE